MSDLSRRIAGLSPEQRALLIQQLEKKRGSTPRPGIRRQPRDTNRFPLSFAQQRLWFLEQLSPGLPTYNVPVALRLRGPIRRAALQRSLSYLVQRHEILRTTFDVTDGQPFQVIGAPRSQPLPVVDLRSLPRGERETFAIRLARQESLQPLDLAHGPLLRTTLLDLGDGELILLLTIHHAICDQWSIDLLIQELIAAYRAVSAGQPYMNGAGPAGAFLPDLPIQYVDYAVWQREWLQGAAREHLLAFWKRQLTGAPAMLNLPTDRSRPAQPTYHGATVSFDLSPAVSALVREVSRKEGCTLFMTLLAAFQTLLYRYSGQDDIVAGTPIANRTHSETEPLIGLFLNTLALRTDLSGNPSFRTLLQRVREVALGAFSHQELPFELLVEELHPRRNLSHAPVFQVFFMFQNLPVQPAELDAQMMEIDTPTSTFDLWLSMMQAGDGITGLLRYNTDIFTDATIRRMVEHFKEMIGVLAAQPDLRIAAVPFLTAAERHQALVEWNATEVEQARDRCLHDLVAEQAARTPDRVAVGFEALHLTYGELERRANRLAQYLHARGIGPEMRVAVCLERSPDLLVGLLGILKTGAAYVPLDPIYPVARLAFMLADAQIHTVLTHQALAAVLPTTSAALLCLDTAWPEIAQTPATPPDTPVQPEHLAYLIYTSGSTGWPKGVQISHRAVVNFLHAMGQRPGLTEQDRLFAITTLAFDIAVLELFLPLAAGARVILAPRAVAADAIQLTKALAAFGATVLQATPATWHMLHETGWCGPASLTRLCGGEALSPDLAGRLCAAGGAVWNMYGPTETTIWSAVGQVAAGAEHVTIGRPIANTQLYVLDAGLALVPVGVVGELYIGGAGIARGYQNRPDLTAERFIPNPFERLEIGDWRLLGGEAPISNLQSLISKGTRLYKTGDLARYRDDGQIEVLGRQDQQIKIRGFRIELGEIETTLRQHPAVEDAVAVTCEDGTGIQQLVSYIVARQEPAPAASDLRRFLQQRLPEYMVPPVFVVLPSFPLTPNGKVDRRALPKPDLIRAVLTAAFVAPRTPLERQLARLWEELLGISPIGAQDDFFDLGGHSLLAVRLIARIQKLFGRDLPVSAFFQGATVESLAQMIGEPTAASESPLVAIQPNGSRQPFFGIHPIGGNVLCYLDIARALGSDQPFYGLQAVDLAELGEQAVRIEEMASSYIAAIRTVQPHGPYLLGGWSFGGIVAFEMAQQLVQLGEPIGLLALMDSYPAMTLGQADKVSDALVLALLAKEEALANGCEFPPILEHLHDLDPEEQLGYVLMQVEQAGLGFSADLPWIQRFLQGYRARQRAVHAYRPSLYPGHITLFKAAQHDSEIAKLQAEMGADFRNPTYGWDSLSAQPVEVHPIPGYHNTLVSGENAAVIAKHLLKCFARVEH